MQLNDTRPVMENAGPPPWLAKLAEDATLEATVLRRPVQGRALIVDFLRRAIPLYDFQDFAYKGPVGEGLFLESYRAAIQGVPVQCLVVAHENAAGEVDSVVINHRPLEAALMFSRLMGEQVAKDHGDGYFLRPSEWAAFGLVRSIREEASATPESP